MSTLVFNAQTLVWTLTETGLIDYGEDTPHTGYNTAVAYPSPAYTCEAVEVPFDPVERTGGTFWKLMSGPDTGKYVSAWTNSLGYGNITVVSDYTPPANSNYPVINPLVDWRILIKGMGSLTGITDTFDRVIANPVSDGWGVSDAGRLWYGTSGRLEINDGIAHMWSVPGTTEVDSMAIILGEGLNFDETISVLFKFRIASSGTPATATPQFKFPMGTNAPEFGSRFYGLTIDPRANVLRLETEGVADVTAPSPVAIDGDTGWMRMRREAMFGSYQRVKIWAEGTAEPVAWTLSQPIAGAPAFGLVGNRFQFILDNNNTVADYGRMDLWIEDLDITGIHSPVSRTPRIMTVSAPTNLYSRMSGTGIRSWVESPPNSYPQLPVGTYKVEPIVIPYDPIHQTGGSHWLIIQDATQTISGIVPVNDPKISVTTDPLFERGPGAVIATLHRPNAHLAGFRTDYNAPGELHFTLLVDDPNIKVVLPKRCHATVEFVNDVTGDWDEVWAGMIWDQDASDTETVFYGLDYLGLLQYCVDERFDPMHADKAAPAGAKYIDKTIKYIVDAQLDYAIGLPDSLVGWIRRGTTAAMNEKVTIFSVMAQTLPFVVGLIDSHRAGTGIFTRLSVRKTVLGEYEFIVEDDPGTNQDGKMIRYGSLAQGYRVIQFGGSWASRVNLIARSAKGTGLLYKSDSSGVDQSEWGRIGQAPIMLVSDDKNDLARRAKQAALDAARMGQQIGPGLKLGSFRPFEDFDICDNLPIEIDHGSVTTKDWGSDVFGSEASPSAVMSNYWTILGVTWESFDDGHWMTSLSLFPKGGGAVSSVPTTSDPISSPVPTTSGWGPPPVTTTSDTYTDLATGVTYKRNDDTETYDVVPGTGSVVDFTFAASTQWVINHTMGGYPRVTLRDVDGMVIDAEIVYTSTSVITVNLSSAVAGSAHLG